MIERCPCCNARLKPTTICPRCRADLSKIIDSEKTAHCWLATAMQLLLENKVEQSCFALQQSLHLKTTKLALIFREFLIKQQSQLIVELLSKSQILAAKKILYQVQLLSPQSKQLQQLATFADYLLLK